MQIVLIVKVDVVNENNLIRTTIFSQLVESLQRSTSRKKFDIKLSDIEVMTGRKKICHQY